MAAEAEAAREARAKIIRARGEEKATRALRAAADELSSNPSAIQLRYLQTLSTIGNEKNTTIVFPVPIDMISHFVNHGKKECSKPYQRRSTASSSPKTPLPALPMIPQISVSPDQLLTPSCPEMAEKVSLGSGISSDDFLLSPPHFET